MAREWALAGVPEEELLPPPPVQQPKTPKGKWENFWYHYKWMTLGILVGAIVLAILIVQMASRNPEDYMLLLVTQDPCPEQQLQLLETELSKYAKDLDGDGTVEVDVQNLYLSTKSSANYQMATTNSQSLTVHLASGDRLLFLFDKTTYDERIQQLLSDGSHFYADTGLSVSGMNEAGYWDWNGSSLQTSEAMKGMPEHLYFGVRPATGTAEKMTKEFEDDLTLLKGFVEAQTAAAQ